MNNEVGSSSLTEGQISECRISAEESSGCDSCDGFNNNLHIASNISALSRTALNSDI